ncbi:MAG: carbamate kinase [Candidatus Aenigmarchaeota archaeon]|nr:carbamate kinase [Candidatus Aenigmarchaeota archaeon]
MQTLVIALGGNAIMPKGKMTIASEFSNVQKAIQKIFPLVKNNHVIITHGNGPQVGNILIRVEAALGKAYPIPLSVAVAESEGELGYVIEQCLVNELSKKKIKKSVVSILTQVLVDKKDPSFKNPTKPVGPFYPKKEAEKMKKKGLHVIFEKTKGWRRVVPSPWPKKIIEAETIKAISRKAVVIAAGGGGIPVIYESGKYRGIDAVIDKDLASACLASSIKADLLLILTDVPFAYENFGKKNEKPIKKMTIKEAKHYIIEGHFAPGSMLPKVQAASEFAQTGGTAIITNPSNLKKALSGKAGTVIKK